MVVPTFATCLSLQLHMLNGDAFVECFAHVIHSECCHRCRHHSLHFNTCMAMLAILYHCSLAGLHAVIIPGMGLSSTGSDLCRLGSWPWLQCAHTAELSPA